MLWNIVYILPLQILFTESLFPTWLAYLASNIIHIFQVKISKVLLRVLVLFLLKSVITALH